MSIVGRNSDTNQESGQLDTEKLEPLGGSSDPIFGQPAPLCPNRQAGPSEVWCFQCGADYTAEVTHCLECGVLTLPYPPTPVTKVGEDDEEQLVYDLHEWSWESRSLMASFMFTEGLVHAWQGASLVVREADEEQVDELVVRVKDTELPVLNHKAGTVEYELAEMSDAQTDSLTTLLANESIPHEFSMAGNLLIQGADEEKVEAVFDTWLQAQAELGVGEFGPGLPGVSVPELLGELHELSRRIAQNVGDMSATKEFMGVVSKLFMLELPFGFSREKWQALRQAAGGLAELLFPGKLEEQLAELLAEVEAEAEEAADSAAEPPASAAEGADTDTADSGLADSVPETPAEPLAPAAPETTAAPAEVLAPGATAQDVIAADVFDAAADPEADDLIIEIKVSAKRLRKLLKEFI